MARRAVASLAAGLCAVATAGAVHAADKYADIQPLDYAAASAWVCRPGACHDDLSATILRADGSTARENFQPVADPPIDCFYVYPTVSHYAGLNAQPPATSDERRAVIQQVERLTSVCRLFVPFYRQVTVTSMTKGPRPSRESEDRAKVTAVTDVEGALDYYLAHDNHGRGLVIIGHSQGAGILLGVIRRKIEGQPAQARLISAILPGAAILVPPGKETGGTFRTIPPCRSDIQLGCVINFNMVRVERPIPESAIPMIRPKGMAQICTNPAALSGGAGFLKPYLSATGDDIIPEFVAPQPPWSEPAVQPSTPFVALPGLYSAACGGDGAYVAVFVVRAPGDHRTGALNGDWLHDGAPEPTMGLHLVDLNLAAGNLVDILRAEAAAYLKAHPAAASGDPAPFPRPGR